MSEETPNEESSTILSDTPQDDGGWYLADGVKGEGEKPDFYVDSKYKSVYEQAKGYSEARKQLGGFTGAPKEGYAIPEGFDSEDELIKEYTELMQGSNANQDLFDKGLQLLQTQMGVSSEVDSAAEMEKLGENAQSRIDTVTQFLKNNAGEDFDEIKELVTDANSVQLVEKLIATLGPKQMPLDPADNSQGLTMADVEEAMYKKHESGRLLRSVDPEYNKKVEAMLAQVVG